MIELAAKQRRKAGKKGKPKEDKTMVGMLLTKMMAGSLTGSARTGMVTCVSQSPRNGEETYLSLKYGAEMAKLLNKPAPQPARDAAALLAEARKQHAASAKVVARGVAGKYQALREAQVCGWAHAISVLEELMG